MFILKGNENILLHLSNFDTFIDIVQVNNVTIEKPINKMTEEEITEMINNIKEADKLYFTSRYNDEFINKVKIIPYMTTESEDDMINIKISDKDNILPTNSKFFIVDYDFEDENYIFSSQKLKETLSLKKTSSNYFNLKIKKNQIFVYENIDNIIVFHEASNLKSK